MRLARLGALGLLGPIFLYLGVAVGGALIPATRGDVSAIGDDQWIILVQGPIHYDILLPMNEQTRTQFAFLTGAGVPVDHFNAAWLSVGWGASAFYTTAGRYRDIRPSAVFRAITGDSGVLRFDVYGPVPDSPHLRRIRISAPQLDALRDGIFDSLATKIPLPMDGFSDTDAFFAATGRFTLFQTCNVWVGQQLAAAGLGFGAWTPTPYAVTLSLWWNGHLTP